MKTNEELQAELDRLKHDWDEFTSGSNLIWDELQKIAPWADSNDMDWCDEILCGIAFAAQKMEVAAEEMKRLSRRVSELEYALGKVRALGTVYVYPEGWNCAKAGGMPPIEEYQEIDLSEIGPP